MRWKHGLTSSLFYLDAGKLEFLGSDGFKLEFKSLGNFLLDFIMSSGVFTLRF